MIDITLMCSPLLKNYCLDSVVLRSLLGVLRYPALYCASTYTVHIVVRSQPEYCISSLFQRWANALPDSFEQLVMDDTSDLDRSARTTSEVGGSSDSISDSERLREARSVSSTNDRAGDSSSMSLPPHQPDERVDDGGSDGRGPDIGREGNDDENEQNEGGDEAHDEDDNSRDGDSDANSVAASDESDGSDYDEPLTLLGSHFVFLGLLYELLFEDDDDDDDD